MLSKCKQIKPQIKINTKASPTLKKKKARGEMFPANIIQVLCGGWCVVQSETRVWETQVQIPQKLPGDFGPVAHTLPNLPHGTVVRIKCGTGEQCQLH